MAHLALRPEPPDGETGEGLLAAYAAAIVKHYPDWSPGQKPTATPAEISPPTGCFLVAYADGEPVGCGAFKRLDDETCEVKRVYVAPGARGLGLARAILAGLENAAREAGYSVARLDTGARLEGAAELFRSAGYEDIEDFNGNPMADFWFEKRLI
jgi:GNAT superfamily N-acetyltransferase